MQDTTDYVFQGGVDPSTSPLLLSPSKAMASMNYEVVAEGYRRMEGIERFDGQMPASSARFWILGFTDGGVQVNVGDRIVGSETAATGWVAQVNLSAGTWSGSAEGTLILTDVEGAFISGEAMKVLGVTVAAAYGEAEREAADDYAMYLDYASVAQDLRRSIIGIVPGSGPVRGVAVFQGTVYAWRDNAGATAGVMWKATPTGWQQVAGSRWTGFDKGNVEIFEGDIITGVTSGATATVARIKKYKGNWGQNSAEGFLVLTGGTGTFVSEDVLVNGTYAASVHGESIVGFAPGGRYMAIEHNFYGASNRTALYFVNGVNTAFEFMEGMLAPVETFSSSDRPTRVFEIGNGLGLCYPGGSIQISVVGEPLLFDAVQGAVEIGFGDEITNVIQANDTAVVIFGASKIGTLTGSDVDTFQYSNLTEEAGAAPWTAQRIGRTVYIDLGGLRDLTATQAYGNFRAGSLLPELQAFFLARQRSGATPVLSYISRTKTQYRVIWDDGVGLNVYMGRKNPEPMLFDISPLRFTCAAEGQNTVSGEIIVCGGDDGYVYQVDSGSSLDGAGIEGFVQPPFNHLGRPNSEKRLHKVTIELDAMAGASIGLSVVFDYGDEGQPNAFLDDQVVFSGGKLWGGAVWDEFFWSGPIRGRGEFPADGVGRNIAVLFACNCKPAEAAHTLQAYTLHWSLKRFVR